MPEAKESFETDKNPNWIRPDLSKEKGEIVRACAEFFRVTPDEATCARIAEALESAQLADLTDEDWKILQNTDSFQNVRPGHMLDVKRITDMYNERLDANGARDVKSIIDGFVANSDMEAPAILRNQEGELHLMSGNTRLMVARALGVRPKAIIAEVDFK